VSEINQDNGEANRGRLRTVWVRTIVPWLLPRLLIYVAIALIAPVLLVAWGAFYRYVGVSPSVREFFVEWIPDNAVALLIDAMLTALITFPLIEYVTYGWARKFDEIKNSLGKQAKEKYLALFQHVMKPPPNVDDTFAEIYTKSYGRRRLIIPIAFVFLIAIFENYFLAVDLLNLTQANGKLQIATSAIAGAYTFVAFDFFGRVQRRNLSIADIMRGALRLAIAIPLGYVFGAITAENLGAFMAFAVGVFPLREIYGILRQQASKRIGTSDVNTPSSTQVVQLSGIDTATSDRLEDADITTVAQLAWCDPIQLTMRTNLHFNFVVDICSQALAAVYFDGKLDMLRPLGLRGAVEMSYLVADLRDEGRATTAEAVLETAFKATGIAVPALKFALGQITDDPYTEFLRTAFLPADGKV